jgi:carboxymethylenebutenolidase
MSRTIAIPSAAGAIPAELADAPGGVPRPLLLLVPSVYGASAGFKRTIDRYASRGYDVVAADPFWRTLPGELDIDRRADARARMDAWSPDEGMADMRATLAWAKDALPHWNGKFAIVGFCFGGQHAMLALTRLGADAAVSYHGAKMDQYLGEAAAMTKPFSFHYGERDGVVPMEQVEQIRAALAGKDGAIFVYPGAGHSFAREGVPDYVPDVAELSERRAFEVLDTLKTPAPVS